MDLRRVGDAVPWNGKKLFVCARKTELRDGMLEFVYILSGREWTWQKRLGNPKIFGMSLFGTVEGCSGETVRLLDDMEGIRIAGSGPLHILAAGEVKIAGSEVRVAGTGGVLLYEGTAEVDREGNIVVAPQGKIELSAEDGERAIHNRGKEVTYYLAWEHEDLSHPSNRYRDASQQKDYDWMKLGTNVAAGLMVAGGIAALAAGGVLLLGAAAATVAKMAMTVFLAGSLYVGEQALLDIRSGRVSDLDQYTRKALAGSVVGFLTGASGLFLTGASLGRVLVLGFGEGLVGNVVTQKFLNEDGELDWGTMIVEIGFSAVTAGLAWKTGIGV